MSLWPTHFSTFVQRATVIGAALCLTVLTASSSVAQVTHNGVSSDMAPGLAAERYRLADPALSTVIQPVRVSTPAETTIDVLSNGVSISAAAGKVTMGLAIGPVYRIKVTGLQMHESVELYPSIEVLGRLYPPRGLENRFPIEVEITRDDLRQAIDGHLVTKVIYLEDGDMVVPHRHSADQQPTFDVSAAEDPLRASLALGRPMAILRIGSRVPLNGELATGIRTLGPAPTILPEPAAVEMSLSDSDRLIDQTREARANLPPITRYAW